MWEYTCFTLFLREGETRVLAAGGAGVEPFPDDEARRPDAAIVTVERLSGDSVAECEGVGEGVDRSRVPEVSLFHGPVLKGAHELAVHVTGRVAGFVKVRFGRFRRWLAGKVDGLPCKLCKEIVTLLASAMLAECGISCLAGQLVDLSGSAGATASAALETILPEGDDPFALAAAIRTTMAAFDWVFEVREEFARQACAVLRYCP